MVNKDAEIGRLIRKLPATVVGLNGRHKGQETTITIRYDSSFEHWEVFYAWLNVEDEFLDFESTDRCVFTGKDLLVALRDIRGTLILGGYIEG